VAGTRGQPMPPPTDQPGHSLAQFAVALLRNAIPVWGFFRANWSPATTLVVYWCETLIGTLLVALRMALHRRLTHKRGYVVEEPVVQVSVSNKGGPARPVRMGYVSGFLVGALGFTFVHGIFLGVLVAFVLPDAGGGSVDRGALREGVLAIGGFLVLGFLLDLVGLRRRPFAWIRSMAEGTFARIIIVHLTIVIGMFLTLALHRARPLFTLFVVLKVLADVTAHTPQWRPKEAPGWMSRLFDRVPGKSGSEDFAAYWKRTQAQEDRREADDERVGKP
jgi:hypothetical protein